jgi:hypothetical protein
MKKKLKPKNHLNEPVSVDNMSKKEFFEWLKDPENRKAYREQAESAARGDDPKLSDRDRTAARICLKHLDEQEHLEAVNAKMKTLIKLFRTAGGSMSVEDSLAEMRRLFDELTDDLLETPEPLRSQFLKSIAPMRQWI